MYRASWASARGGACELPLVLGAFEEHAEARAALDRLHDLGWEVCIVDRRDTIQTWIDRVGEALPPALKKRPAPPADAAPATPQAVKLRALDDRWGAERIRQRLLQGAAVLVVAGGLGFGVVATIRARRGSAAHGSQPTALQAPAGGLGGAPVEQALAGLLAGVIGAALAHAAGVLVEGRTRAWPASRRRRLRLGVAASAGVIALGASGPGLLRSALGRPGANTTSASALASGASTAGPSGAAGDAGAPTASNGAPEHVEGPFGQLIHGSGASSGRPFTQLLSGFRSRQQSQSGGAAPVAPAPTANAATAREGNAAPPSEPRAREASPQAREPHGAHGSQRHGQRHGHGHHRAHDASSQAANDATTRAPDARPAEQRPAEQRHAPTASPTTTAATTPARDAGVARPSAPATPPPMPQAPDTTSTAAQGAPSAPSASTEAQQAAGGGAPASSAGAAPPVPPGGSRGSGKDALRWLLGGLAVGFSLSPRWRRMASGGGK
ncbi:MAG: hypothetical protein U0324_20955 [Polyangiales bacterium]